MSGLDSASFGVDSANGDGLVGFSLNGVDPAGFSANGEGFVGFSADGADSGGFSANGEGFVGFSAGGADSGGFSANGEGFGVDSRAGGTKTDADPEVIIPKSFAGPGGGLSLKGTLEPSGRVEGTFSVSEEARGREMCEFFE
jgi:hypothetical protein